MRKKFFLRFLIAIAMMLSVLGCGKDEQGRPVSGNKATLTPTLTAAPTDSPKPTRIPDVDITFSPELLETELVSFDHQESEFTNTPLYRLTGLQTEVHDFVITPWDTLVTINYPGTSRLLEFTEINLKTGETKEYELTAPTSELEDLDYYFQLYTFDNCLMVAEGETGSFYTLSRNFKIIDQHLTRAKRYTRVECLTEDSLLLWEENSNDYTILTITNDGTITDTTHTFEVLEGAIVTQLSSVLSDTSVLIGILTKESAADYDVSMEQLYYDYDYYVIYDLVTGESTKLPVPSTAYVTHDGDNIVFIDYSTDLISVFSPLRKNQIMQLAVPEEYYALGDPFDHHLFFYNSDWDNSRLCIKGMDMASGNLIASIAIEFEEEPEYFYLDSVRAYEGYFFLLTDFSDSKELYCCKPELPSNDPGYDFICRPNYSDDNRELIRLIERDYPILVFTEGSGVEYNSDYFMVAEFDPQTINNALKALYKTLQNFPLGFFEEVLDNAALDSINIYFTGSIRQNPYSYNTLPVAGAFVTSDGNAKQMFVDITDYNYAATFAHELMHIIESGIHASRLTKNCLDHFEDMNPKGFSYGESYADTDGNNKFMKYCASSYEEVDEYGIPKDVYFVDDYAMTYLTEDLARMFETLMKNDASSLPDAYRSEPIRNKMVYLCWCIRESFSCITDDTILPWEYILETETKTPEIPEAIELPGDTF